jgi:PadR family transcriptional regulator PadR
MTPRLTKKELDGNVETIILAELARGANYGYALVKAINDRHEGLLQLGEGTIYPVLYRMEEKGLVGGEMRKGPTGRARKYYEPTEAGLKLLANNLKQWSTLTRVMDTVRQGLALPLDEKDNPGIA